MSLYSKTIESNNLSERIADLGSGRKISGHDISQNITEYLEKSVRNPNMQDLLDGIVTTLEWLSDPSKRPASLQDAALEEVFNAFYDFEAALSSKLERDAQPLKHYESAYSTRKEDRILKEAGQTLRSAVEGVTAGAEDVLLKQKTYESPSYARPNSGPVMKL